MCLHCKLVNRTQIQLTDEQIRKLRRAARAQGLSVAEVVRRLIDQGIDAAIPGTPERYERAARWLGAFQDRAGTADISTRHDEFLERAYR